MSYSSKSSFLEEAVSLLVHHFGVQKVRKVLAKVSNGIDEKKQKPLHTPVPPEQKLSRPTVAAALELIREREPEKHRLLSEFYSRLKDRKTLPESQDIRHFSQLVGLKILDGKSRKDMILPLMFFLVDQPIERLSIDLKSADNISERQRQLGYSVLTDKLVGKK
ncbi:MAG: hypothetical protein HY291_20100 [Planctomycetes bacterium]|nr:hypothetical protein [Planctomycetota bacterium]